MEKKEETLKELRNKEIVSYVNKIVEEKGFYKPAILNASRSFYLSERHIWRILSESNQ